MNAKTLTLSLIAAGVLSAAGYGLYRMGMQQGMQHTASPSNAMPASAPSAAPAVAMVDPSTWGIPQGEAATRRHMESGIKAGQVDPETGREVLYYHDPMTPGKKFEAPGKSPFMDMMLVPAYAGSARGGRRHHQCEPAGSAEPGLAHG